MRNLAFPGAFSLRVRYSQLLNVPSENENWHSNRHATGCDPCRAICVQRFDDSLNSAIHITYRSSLRSSSMHEPRDPPLKVVKFVFLFLTQVYVISIYLLKQRERVCTSRLWDARRWLFADPQELSEKAICTTEQSANSDCGLGLLPSFSTHFS